MYSALICISSNKLNPYSFFGQVAVFVSKRGSNVKKKKKKIYYFPLHLSFHYNITRDHLINMTICHISVQNQTLGSHLKPTHDHTKFFLCLHFIFLTKVSNKGNILNGVRQRWINATKSSFSLWWASFGVEYCHSAPFISPTRGVRAF